MNETKFLITGATGLIGTALTKALLKDSANRVLILVRSLEKARDIFSDYLKNENLEIILCEGGVEHFDYNFGGIDYIIHAANPTSSKFFVEYPVDTINIAVRGTDNILRIAKENKVKGIVFLSSMEVYGTPNKGKKITEADIGAFNTTNTRNCYPLSKQICENLCYAYYTEYDVPVKIARLTQTFGPGVDYNDSRVFAEFARCAIEKRNIVLKTKGETERCYLYIDDAVSAILKILFNGKSGEAYTVANDATYCSIYEMASMVAKEYGINVVIDEEDAANYGYADTLYMDLDTSKIRNLGWKPQVDLLEMYKYMISDMMG